MTVPETSGPATLSGPGRLVLLLLDAAGSAPIPGRTHLQKEAFVVSRAVPALADDLGFEPYLMGPHSSVLADEAEQLELSELVTAANGPLVLTAAGKAYAAQIERRLPEHDWLRVTELKSLLNDMTRDELLAFVYFGLVEEPLEEESEEYERLVPIRGRLARSLLKKGKVSPSRAAEIAGVALEQFLIARP